MAMKKNVPLSEAELLRYLDLLGSPPVLSSENPKHYKEIFLLVAACVKPQNMIEVINLWHYTCASWFIKRYLRHATLAIERHTAQTREFHAARAALRQQRKSDLERVEVQKLTETPADVARMVRLENNIDAAVDDVDAILDTAERDQNKALQQGIGLQEQLNTLIISQTAIRNDALRQLELFRMGLGRLVSEATDKILEGECEKEVDGLPQETEAPSIAPSGDASCHDVEPQNRSESAQ
jgi:hypothetical protein